MTRCLEQTLEAEIRATAAPSATPPWRGSTPSARRQGLNAVRLVAHLASMMPLAQPPETASSGRRPPAGTASAATKGRDAEALAAAPSLTSPRGRCGSRLSRMGRDLPWRSSARPALLLSAEWFSHRLDEKAPSPRPTAPRPSRARSRGCGTTGRCSRRTFPATSETHAVRARESVATGSGDIPHHSHGPGGPAQTGSSPARVVTRAAAACFGANSLLSSGLAGEPRLPRERERATPSCRAPAR
jgi:hypothetical protein